MGISENYPVHQSHSELEIAGRAEPRWPITKGRKTISLENKQEFL